MIVLVVLAPTRAPVKPVAIEEDAVDHDRYLDHLHAMAELVWADFCREDER